MTEAPQKPTPGGLISDALAHLARIMRGEMALAQAEVTASVRTAAIGVAMLAGAAILMITALNLLSAALVAVVIHAGLAPAWAAVAVGVVFVVLALILARIGLNALKPSGFVPVRTLRGLRRDAETLKEGLTE